MANLELRRAALEADGWTEIHFMKGCASVCSDWAGVNPRTQQVDWLPAVESDPAVSEPWFLHWCKTFKWYQVDFLMSEKYGVQLQFSFEVNGGNRVIGVNGATMSEARARCVVAAVKAKEKA